MFLALTAWTALPRVLHASETQGLSSTSPAPPIAPTRLVSTSATGDLYQLLLKYEPVPAGQPTAFIVSVRDLQSGAPITGAAVELRLVNAHAELRPSLPPTAEPGNYTATVTFPVDGDYETVAQVTRNGEIDLVLLETVRVGALPGTAAGAAHARLQQILLGAVVLFILGMLTLSLVTYRRSSRPGASPTPPPA
jgi:hypothetical protein